MWLSLVERYVRDVEVAGSNPVTPIFESTGFMKVRVFCYYFLLFFDEDFLTEKMKCAKE